MDFQAILMTIIAFSAVISVLSAIFYGFLTPVKDSIKDLKDSIIEIKAELRELRQDLKGKPTEKGGML